MTNELYADVTIDEAIEIMMEIYKDLKDAYEEGMTPNNNWYPSAKDVAAVQVAVLAMMDKRG